MAVDIVAVVVVLAGTVAALAVVVVDTVAVALVAVVVLAGQCEHNLIEH